MTITLTPNYLLAEDGSRLLAENGDLLVVDYTSVDDGFTPYAIPNPAPHYRWPHGLRGAVRPTRRWL